MEAQSALPQVQFVAVGGADAGAAPEAKYVASQPQYSAQGQQPLYSQQPQYLQQQPLYVQLPQIVLQLPGAQPIPNAAPAGRNAPNPGITLGI